jgi:hypothetical protein
MPTIEDRIKAIEEEIRKTPYNKATQHHIGKLKAKIARLKGERVKKKSKGKGFSIKKSGDATIGIVGFPSVGKSTLLNAIAKTKSKIADYDFTTTKIIPGMIECKGSKIQILDLPGIIEGASIGKGRGKEVISVMRNVDLLILMVEADNTKILDIMEKELRKSGIRLNQDPPNVRIEKKDRGGINIITNHKIDEEMIKEIAKRHGIINANIIVRENITKERFIDFLSNRIYIPAIIIANKIDKDNIDWRDREKLKHLGFLPISAKEKIGIDELKKKIFEKLGFIRIYTRSLNGKVDSEPLILRNGSTIKDAYSIIKKRFNFRYARIWGPSAKFQGQKVGMEHKLKDGDTLTIVG